MDAVDTFLVIGDIILLLTGFVVDFSLCWRFADEDFEFSELSRDEVVFVLELWVGDAIDFWSFFAFEEAVGDMKLEEREIFRASEDPVDFLSLVTSLGELTFNGRMFGDLSDCVLEREEFPAEVLLYEEL